MPALEVSQLRLEISGIQYLVTAVALHCTDEGDNFRSIEFVGLLKGPTARARSFPWKSKSTGTCYDCSANSWCSFFMQHDQICCDAAAFSATETLESHFALVTKQMAPVLGPQQLVSCMANPDKCGGSGGCQGATQPLAFTYTETTGFSLESSYPRTGQTGTCDTSNIAPVVTNTGVVQLPTNSFSALIGAVAAVGPVSISVAAGSWSSSGGGVYSGSCDNDMDQILQLVGYGEDSGRLHWIVRTAGALGGASVATFVWSASARALSRADSIPQDGMACAGDTTPVQHCGKCAILSASNYPTAVSAAPPTPTPPSPPHPKPFLLLVLGLSKECRGVNASWYQ